MSNDLNAFINELTNVEVDVSDEDIKVEVGSSKIKRLADLVLVSSPSGPNETVFPSNPASVDLSSWIPLAQTSIYKEEKFPKVISPDSGSDLKYREGKIVINNEYFNNLDDVDRILRHLELVPYHICSTTKGLEYKGWSYRFEKIMPGEETPYYNLNIYKDELGVYGVEVNICA